MLQQWCDSIVTMITKLNPLIKTFDGRREWGLFHHISGDELDKISNLISGCTNAWGRDCAANNVSCGIRPKGLASTTITQQFWGPFLALGVNVDGDTHTNH